MGAAAGEKRASKRSTLHAREVHSGPVRTSPWPPRADQLDRLNPPLAREEIRILRCSPEKFAIQLVKSPAVNL
jgi:hypothetical protein